MTQVRIWPAPIVARPRDQGTAHLLKRLSRSMTSIVKSGENARNGFNYSAKAKGNSTSVLKAVPGTGSRLLTKRLAIISHALLAPASACRIR